MKLKKEDQTVDTLILLRKWIKIPMQPTNKLSIGAPVEELQKEPKEPKSFSAPYRQK